MAKSGIYAFGVIYQTKVVYVYQDKIGHVEKGKISIWIRLSIFRVAEEYLSNVYTCFPRVTNKIDEVYEMSLDVSCPEAARLILLNKEKINDFCYKIKAKKLLSGIYYVNGNKLSKTDFMLLYLCSINENSVIVTEDKKLLKASKDILGNNKSINLKEFLISLN